MFDVSHKSDTYGPGKSYNLFAGKDASKALGKSSLKPEEAVPDYSDLPENEMKVLNDWHVFFTYVISCCDIVRSLNVALETLQCCWQSCGSASRCGKSVVFTVFAFSMSLLVCRWIACTIVRRYRIDGFILRGRLARQLECVHSLKAIVTVVRSVRFLSSVSTPESDGSVANFQ